jgi:hypothetical protein
MGWDEMVAMYPQSLGRPHIAAAMHCKIEVCITSVKQSLHTNTTGLNVHVPFALPPNSGGGGYWRLDETDFAAAKHRGWQNLSSFHADDSCVSLVQF